MNIKRRSFLKIFGAAAFGALLPGSLVKAAPQTVIEVQAIGQAVNEAKFGEDLIYTWFQTTGVGIIEGNQPRFIHRAMHRPD